jgi:TonB-dependent SusC/RagA subfamily outer membrane receptor
MIWLMALSARPRRGRMVSVFFGLLLASIPCGAQRKVSIKGNGLPIDSILNMVEGQTGYDFQYSSDIFVDWPGVDLDLKKVSIPQFLETCFAGLNFRYTIKDNTVVIRREPPNAELFLNLRGRIVNEAGQPLPHVRIEPVNSPADSSQDDGTFSIPVHQFSTPVWISIPGFAGQLKELSNKTEQDIVLQPIVGDLDEIVIFGHRNTTKRNAHGSSFTLSNRAIALQHGSNPLDLLQAEAPGLKIVRTNGYSESGYTVLLRGQRSIGAGNDPYYIIDGVPFPSTNFIGVIGPGSPTGGSNPLNGISPEDIESITVLSGPGATAEYGSRAANGVILISLKKGQPGKVTVTAGLTDGQVRARQGSHLLNTQQFLQLRSEAVINDGYPADSNYVPELKWGSTRYRNFQKEILGNTGRMGSGHINLSGGSSNYNFLLSGTTSRQSAVLPGTTSDSRQSVYGYLHLQSADSRLKMDISGLYSWQDEALPLTDLTRNIYLAPNAPTDNLSMLEDNTYTLGVHHFMGHLTTSWKVMGGLLVEGSLGTYLLKANEKGTTTIAGQPADPTNPPTGSLFLGTNDFQGKTAELVVHYSKDLWLGRLESFVGGNVQTERRNTTNTSIDGFNSDLEMVTGNGGMARFSNNQVDYKYAAVFGQLSYDLEKKYVLTLTGRRDGSSRWSKNNRYGNFASINGSWVFSDERVVRDWSWLKLGKLRYSWGTVGNDQIPDYQFARAYANVSAGGVQGLQPTSLYNPNLKWELYYNEELALDLGFLDNKMGLSAVAYRTWSANQLVESRLAGQAGEPGIFNDLPITVQNEGLELVLRATIGQPGSFQWGSSLNLTIPRNKLVHYPGLAMSSNATRYVEGQSLSVSKGFHYTGVNDTTGLYTFAGFVASKSRDPHCYGSWANSFSYRQWQLDLVFSVNFQNGYDPLILLDEQNLPGAGAPAPSQLSNGPVEWLDRWQKPGDHASRQRLTSMPGTAAADALNRYISSDAAVIDASYGRLKTVSLSWRLKGLQIYIRGHDLLTLTHYPVTDPEVQNPNVLPPGKSWQAGFTITF